MPLSSNTLIHFTNKKETLFKILEESFKIYHCKEVVVLGGKRHVIYVPMVSFCDIPMSEIKDHIGKYGCYGIGLTKEWAVKNKLNPVLYISAASTLSDSYRTAVGHFVRLSGADGGATPEEMALLDILRYMKNYEGKLERKTETIENYRFSDEREWRFVPDYLGDEQMLVRKADFEENPHEYSGEFDHLRLQFDPSDIKYIIIKDETEIGEFVEHLRKTGGKKCTVHELERLTTRILTTEQIMGDF
jgi:hypothetical protein